KKLNITLIAEKVTNFRKGFDLAIKALQKCANKDSIRIFIIGGGQFDFDLACEIIYFGKIEKYEELRLIYSASDFLLLPSREDNLPNTMLESLLCGTPVIAFGTGGMTDHIKEDETG